MRRRRADFHLLPCAVYVFPEELSPVNLVMNDLFGTFHELFRFGDAALDMFEAYGIDKTVADTIIHDKFHI